MEGASIHNFVCRNAALISIMLLFCNPVEIYVSESESESESDNVSK